MRRDPRPYRGDPSTRGVRSDRFVQCDNCGATGTVMLRGGRAGVSGIVMVKKGDVWFHGPCKRGRLVAYDIAPKGVTR